MNKLIVFIIVAMMAATPALAQEGPGPEYDTAPTASAIDTTRGPDDYPDEEPAIANSPEDDTTQQPQKCPEGLSPTPTGECGQHAFDPEKPTTTTPPRTNDTPGYKVNDCPDGWEMTSTGECGLHAGGFLPDDITNRKNLQNQAETTQVKQQTTRKEVKEKRQEMKAKVAERREEIKDRLQTRLGQVARTIVARFENMTHRLDNLRDRVEKAIEKAETDGRDASEAQAALSEVDTALSSANIAIDKMKTMVDTWLATETDDDFRTQIQDGREEFRSVVGEAKEELKKAWEALRKGVGHLKNSRLEADTAKSTDEDSDTNDNDEEDEVEETDEEN